MVCIGGKGLKAYMVYTQDEQFYIPIVVSTVDVIHTLCDDEEDEVSRIFPTLSTGGAPHTKVLRCGSRSHGNRWSRCCNKPLVDSFLSTTPASPPNLTRSFVLSSANPCVVVEAEANPTVIDPVVPAAPVLLAPTPASLRALASSSISSNTSCFTALIEYAHMPTANAPRVRPRRVFLTR